MTTTSFQGVRPSAGRRALLLLAILAAAVVLFASPAHADAPFTVWLSPTGSDTGEGTQAAPVLTLARAEDIVRAASPAGDVEIRIHAGTYVAGQVTWDFYIPGHTISFMPDDFEIGGNAASIAARPVFQTDGSPGYWLVAKIPTSWTSSAPLVAGLRFYYLQVQRYGQGGLMFYGRTSVVDGYLVPGAGLNGNTVAGMIFQEIGSAWTPEIGYGGISLSNSSNNYIGNSHFSHLEDVAPSQAAIHGIYALHGSSNNTITNNAFNTISGHPMRTRDRSSGNNVYGNTFTLTGGAGYSEWFCDETCAAANPGSVLECASQGNVFHNNTLVSAYDGSYLKSWWLSPAGLDNPGPAGCPPLSGPRLATYGNVQ